MATVYVLSKNGKPLMPTTRCGHVRFLLKENKARVVERYPFTIQLTYDTEEQVQPVTLGIDPGRTNIGLAAVTEDGKCVAMAQLVTRNKEIPKLMRERKQFRQAHRRLKRRKKRQRRAKASGTMSPKGTIERILPGCEEPIHCKGIRNKEARFNNRARPSGWLTPTANHLLLTHLNIVKKLQKFLPITDVVLEVNRFAFMQMDNPHIQRWQYQRGPLYGKGSVEDAVFDMQDGYCLFCKKGIDHYHHVVPRHKNGSETLENRVGLCEKHHRLVHTEETWAQKLASKKAGMNKRYHALSVLNQIIPKLTEGLAALFPGHFYVTDGQSTAAFRRDHEIAKDHHLDAYCIACSVLRDAKKVREPGWKPQLAMQFRRHDRQACNQANVARKYYDTEGTLVATNRHKAMDQKSDSLEEYRKTHTVQELTALTVRHKPPQYKEISRTMPGSVIRNISGKAFVLFRSDGRHGGQPDYYVDKRGVKAPARKCKILQNNRGLQFCD